MQDPRYSDEEVRCSDPAECVLDKCDGFHFWYVTAVRFPSMKIQCQDKYHGTLNLANLFVEGEALCDIVRMWRRLKRITACHFGIEASYISLRGGRIIKLIKPRPLVGKKSDKRTRLLSRA